MTENLEKKLNDNEMVAHIRSLHAVQKSLGVNLPMSIVQLWQREYAKFPSYKNLDGAEYTRLMQKKYKDVYANCLQSIVEMYRGQGI